jgi:hypothetical protein
VPVKWQRVQLVVWLDLPYPLILYQVIKRSLRRSLFREELWSGNRESLAKAFFSHLAVHGSRQELLTSIYTAPVSKSVTPAAHGLLA